MVEIAADAAWRSRIIAAARAAGTTVIDAAPREPEIGVLACASGNLSLLVPLIKPDPPVTGRLDAPTIGAYSDSIADLELRDAVADVAALLSLHGTVILDLDAGRSRWRRTPRPDIVVSGGQRPSRPAGAEVSLPVGPDSTGRPMVVRLTASPGFEHILLELARIVELDQRPARAA
jgi:hypothetical protein